MDYEHLITHGHKIGPYGPVCGTSCRDGRNSVKPQLPGIPAAMPGLRQSRPSKNIGHFGTPLSGLGTVLLSTASFCGYPDNSAS